MDNRNQYKKQKGLISKQHLQCMVSNDQNDWVDFITSANSRQGMRTFNKLGPNQFHSNQTSIYYNNPSSLVSSINDFEKLKTSKQNSVKDEHVLVQNSYAENIAANARIKLNQLAQS